MKTSLKMGSTHSTIPRHSDLDHGPQSFSQQRFWFLDQLESQKCAYNVSWIMMLNGHLQLQVLERALTEIVQRHTVLRSTFSAIEDQPVQTIQPTCFTIEFLATPDETMMDLRKAIAHYYKIECNQPFDLANGPVIRARLLPLDPQKHVLFLSMHHIVIDGWSMGILAQEIATLYTAFVKDQASPPSRVTNSVHRLCAMAATRASGGSLREPIKSLETNT